MLIVYYAVIPVMIVAVNMSGFMLGEVVGWMWGGAPPPLLPVSRVKEDPAFNFTGADFAGPLMIPLKVLTRLIRHEFVCLPAL